MSHFGERHDERVSKRVKFLIRKINEYHHLGIEETDDEAAVVRKLSVLTDAEITAFKGVGDSTFVAIAKKFVRQGARMKMGFHNRPMTLSAQFPVDDLADYLRVYGYTVIPPIPTKD